VAHHTLRSAYGQLAERVNKLPVGAPATDLLFKILSILFSEREAGLVAQIPVLPFTARRAARIWKMDLNSARKVLDELTGRAVLLDFEILGVTHYLLPPPMAGFFEFSMMRLRPEIDQRQLAELYYQYINVEPDFARALFGGETQLSRVYVNEQAIAPQTELHVLDYERASHIAGSARHIAVGLCYCRHKMQHLGRACDAPLDICMTFNETAGSLIRHGNARRVELAECLDLLQRASDLDLLQIGENVQQSVSFICNCCGCCCEALLAQKRFSTLRPITTTNFIPQLSPQRCKGCGKCVAVCPVEAMTLVSAEDPERPKRRRARLDERLCLGCGVCVKACPNDGVTLVERPQRVITPVSPAHRTVIMAVERGKLQELILDNHVLLDHRAVSALLGAIIALPPLGRALATEQLNSRFLRAAFERGSDLFCQLLSC
jgi:ferredoxin